MTSIATPLMRVACLVGIVSTVAAGAAVAGEAGSVGIDYARDIQERTNMPQRGDSRGVVQVQVQDLNCPGRGDSTACWNMQVPGRKGEIIGTASRAPEPVKANADPARFGRK